MNFTMALLSIARRIWGGPVEFRRHDRGWCSSIARPSARCRVPLGSGWWDRWIVDGLVRFVGGFLRTFSSFLRLVQTGYAQNYALMMVLGVLILIGYARTSVRRRRTSPSRPATGSGSKGGSSPRATARR